MLRLANESGAIVEAISRQDIAMRGAFLRLLGAGFAGFLFYLASVALIAVGILKSP